ncbi:MAG: hypothetical protein ABEI86_04570, partial [Halobacteriaceae archaeon]
PDSIIGASVLYQVIESGHFQRPLYPAISIFAATGQLTLDISGVSFSLLAFALFAPFGAWLLGRLTPSPTARQALVFTSPVWPLAAGGWLVSQSTYHPNFLVTPLAAAYVVVTATRDNSRSWIGIQYILGLSVLLFHPLAGLIALGSGFLFYIGLQYTWVSLSSPRHFDFSIEDFLQRLIAPISLGVVVIYFQVPRFIERGFALILGLVSSTSTSIQYQCIAATPHHSCGIFPRMGMILYPILFGVVAGLLYLGSVYRRRDGIEFRVGPSLIGLLLFSGAAVSYLIAILPRGLLVRVLGVTAVFTFIPAVRCYRDSSIGYRIIVASAILIAVVAVPMFYPFPALNNTVNDVAPPEEKEQIYWFAEYREVNSGAEIAARHKAWAIEQVLTGESEQVYRGSAWALSRYGSPPSATVLQNYGWPDGGRLPEMTPKYILVSERTANGVLVKYKIDGEYYSGQVAITKSDVLSRKPFGAVVYTAGNDTAIIMD